MDYLLGLKENVIMGHLIPAGTGLKHFRNIMVFTSDSEEEEGTEPGGNGARTRTREKENVATP